MSELAEHQKADDEAPTTELLPATEVIERADVAEVVEAADVAENTDVVDITVVEDVEEPKSAGAGSDPQRRRRWIGRGILAVILVVEATLALHDQNSAFQDEALYIFAGHMEISHWLHGTPLNGGFDSYFSGVPVLYPVLAALGDSVAGLAGARFISLLAMLGTTGLLYTTSRRLFDERVACCAAAVFAMTEPSIFLGNFATFDACTIFLLAVGFWIVVRTAHRRGFAYLSAAPVLALAVGFKYFAVLFVPVVALVAGIVASTHVGRRAWFRPPLLAAAVGGIFGGAISLAGHGFVHDVVFNATSRVHGTVGARQILKLAGEWAGPLAALALLGCVLYVRRAQTEPSDAGLAAGPLPGRRTRLTLGLVLLLSVTLAPASQMRIGSGEGLNRHIGYGMLFAAPMAGIGLARIIGDHFRRVQIGIAAWIIVLVFGVQQARNYFTTWPDSSTVNSALAAYERPGYRTYIDVSDVPIYYLHGWNDLSKWVSGYGLTFADATGVHTGLPAYQKAIQDGYFDIVAYNPSFYAQAAADQVVAKAIKASPKYRLVAVLPMQAPFGDYYIWIRRH